MKVSQIYDVIVENTGKTDYILPDDAIQKLKKTVEDSDVSSSLKDVIKNKYKEFVYKDHVNVTIQSMKDNGNRFIFNVYRGMYYKESLTVELRRKRK